MNFKLWFSENKDNKPNKLGKYKITYINSEKFRKSSIKNVEFCTVAIHSDFPNAIGKYEIFIDNSIKANEIPSLLVGLKKRLKHNKQDDKLAYDKSMQAEKKYRKLNVSKLKKKKFYVLKDYKNDFEVFYVNGKSVRDKFKTDFSQGGHEFVYDWIPKNEIWIEEEEKEEVQYILAHEYLELVMMRDLKMNYNDAHYKASEIEQKLRKSKFSFKDFDIIIKNIDLLL